jgi:hypothetical protein
MENGPAKQAGLARQLQQAGDQVADMFEVCTLYSSMICRYIDYGVVWGFS